LNAKYVVLAQKQAELEALQRNLAGEQAEIEQLINQKAAILEERTQQTRALQVEVNRREEEIRAIEALLSRIQARMQAEIERLKREGSKSFPLPEYAPGNGWLRPAEGYVSAAYGVRTWLQPFHTGIDYAAAQFSPVWASQDGQVIHVDYAIPGNRYSSYGMMVIVAHSLHEASLYAHLDDQRVPPPVKVGDVVRKGNVIGYVGMTGFTSGPHTHFEIRVDGLTANPAQWLG
jgi:murein DD-endopeptidase MepM/ murein hydrolase activator NlpD